MTNRTLAAAIRKHRGEVLVPVLVPHGVRHLPVTKRAILRELGFPPPG